MIQTSLLRTEPLSVLEEKKILQDVAAALSTLQTAIEGDGRFPSGALDPTLPALRQAQEALQEADLWLRRDHRVRRTARAADPLQTLLDILPVGIAIVQDIGQRTMTLNRAGLRILNLPRENNSFLLPLEGSLPFKFLRAGKELPAEETPILQAITQKVPVSDVELEVKHSTGKVINLIVYASPLYNSKGRATGSLGVMVDISVRKSIEQRLSMQYGIAHILAEANTINKAAPQVMQMICETAHWQYGAFWQVEPDLTTLTNKGVWYGKGTGLENYAENALYSLIPADEDTLPGSAFRNGRPIWLANLEASHSGYIEEARRAGLRSAYIMPVKSRKKVIAVLECFSTQPQEQDRHLSDMLGAVGNQVGIFLERKVLEETLAVRAYQQHLLAEAGMSLSSSLELKERLRNIARLVVPEIADWCAIDVIDKDNNLERVAVAHVDEQKEGYLLKLQPNRKIDFKQSNTPQIQTLVTGQSLVYPELPESLLKEQIKDSDQQRIIRLLNPISSIIVPLIAHNQILGIFTLVQSDSERRYTQSDLPLAEDIARRTALAVDNALLYTESQKLNAELEQRVDKRTVQLKLAIEELTKQVKERQNAEERIRILNLELEERIEQRTAQLEIANQDLNKELIDRKKTAEALKAVLKRTRELYRISQTIGVVKTPNEVVSLLLSSSYLKNSSRASIAILDRTWVKNEPPPEHCFILTEWNRGITQPKFFGQRFTLEEYGVKLPVPYGEPIVVQDIQSVMDLPPRVRKRFSDLKTHSLIILPLIAGGEWYGLLSLHFNTRRMMNMDDLRHMRGLVDEAAIVIKNMRLLEAESQARQEAERANELKLKFLGMISHELRTPLTSIKGFTTTLLADDVEWPPEKQRDFLSTINQESDKLHELIEQLLDLSRIEAGVLRIAPVETSLQRVIDLAMPQLVALTSGHVLKIQLPPHLPSLHADEQRIAQVITNLVNNATKFSPLKTQITLSAYRSQGEVQVDIADEGGGIPPAEREHIFQAFRQLENSRQNGSKGAGLGLAICKGLIEAHKGRIWVQDRAGGGTVFSFTLPASEK